MKYEIGSKIRYFREIQGYSQKEFAYRIGVSNSRVSNWEQGINRPDADILATICEVLKVSADELLDIKISKSTPLVSTGDQPFLKKYRRLNDSGKEYIDSQLDYALMQDKYTQGDDDGNPGSNVAG